MGTVQRVVITGILLENNKVLIVKRSEKETFFPGKWELPSGKVEFGESVDSALEREFREEVDQIVNRKEPVFVFDYTLEKKDEKRHCVEIVFLVIREEKREIKLCDEHTDFRWIGPDEISLVTGPIGEAIKLAFSKKQI